MRFRVENMSCGHCVAAITSALRTIDPAAEVAVDLAAGTVTLRGRLDPARAVAVMAEEGYPATLSDAGDDNNASRCGSCHG